MNLIVKNGTVVLPTGVYTLDLSVKDGKINEIGFDLSGENATVVDAKGLYVLPGVVDTHVHFNDPGLTDREDMYTGTCAAAAGGVTSIFDMPLSGNPTITTPEALELKKQAAKEKAVVDYALWGGLINDNTSSMLEMYAQGARVFKAFTCFAGKDFPSATNGILYKGMREALKCDSMIGTHCEDYELVELFEKEAKERGDFTVRSFLDAHAPITETLASNTFIELCQNTGARCHVCHASLPEVIDLVTDAKERGAHITVETCPHYLIFSEKDLEEKGPVLKCTPPVRTDVDRELMWEKVFDGSVDLISSDHSPSTIALKNPASGNFWEAWGGVQGVQTMLSALFTEGVKKRGMKMEQLMQLISSKPAQIFGIYPQKGSLLPGSDADIVLFDPNEEWTVTPENIFYKNKHTPYMGMTLTGKVKETYVRGKRVYADGKIEAERGQGEMLFPKQS